MSVVNLAAYLDAIEDKHRERCGEQFAYFPVPFSEKRDLFGLAIAEATCHGYFRVASDLVETPYGSFVDMAQLAEYFNRTRLARSRSKVMRIVGKSMARDLTRSTAKARSKP